jgi:hypothetical protein
MAHPDLMKYFNFDGDDLYANQNGRFTEKQRVNLMALDKSRRKSSMTIGILLAAVGAIGPIITILSALGNPGPAFLIGFGIGFGLVWPLVWGGIGYVMIKGAMGKTVLRWSACKDAPTSWRESLAAPTATATPAPPSITSCMWAA